MRHFYKYVTHKTGEIVIKNGTLRWSIPAVLNDPYDSQIRFQLRVDWELARQKALEKMWDHRFGDLRDDPLNLLGLVTRMFRGSPGMSKEEFCREFGEAVDESNTWLREKGIGELNELLHGQLSVDHIICFSEVPDQILMWSHYADNHKGIVLRFTDDPPNSPLRLAKPVRYLDQMPSLFDTESISDMLAGYGNFEPERLIGEIIWTKSGHWAYEREWRVWYANPNNDPLRGSPTDDAPFYPEELDGVIFGAKMPQVERAPLVSLVREKFPHAELLQARLQEDSFEVAIEPADI